MFSACNTSIPSCFFPSGDALRSFQKLPPILCRFSIVSSGSMNLSFGHVISADDIAVDPEQWKSFSWSCQLVKEVCAELLLLFLLTLSLSLQNFSKIAKPMTDCCARVSGIRGHQLVSQLSTSWRRSWSQLQFSHRQMSHSLFRCFVMPHCRG